MKIKQLWEILLVPALGLYLMSCAGSRPKPAGIEEAEKKQKVNEILDLQKTAETDTQRTEEDEVLKLLGITPEEKTEKVTSATSSDTALEQKIAELEEAVNKREQEVEQLRAELRAKENKIVELESILNDLKTVTPEPTTVTTSTAVNKSEFKLRYNDALNEYRNRHYKKAIKLFESLIQLDPNTSLSDNCQYWIGECYYGLGKYEQAIVEFEKVFAFVNSNKEDAAQLKIGLCYLRLNNKKRAKEELERLVMKYPQSEYLPRARRLLKQL